MATRARVMVVLVLAALLAACGALGPAGDSPASSPTTPETGGEWEPVYDDGVLQPLPDGFPESPITLVNMDDPGSDDGIYARVMQEALQDISPVEVRVLDRPSPVSGTPVGLEFAASQEGGNEGYYAIVAAMTGGALDFLTEPVTEEYGITLEDLNPVIATERAPFVVVSRTDAPWTTYEEMVEYAKENPGELRYIAAVGSQLDIAMERLMDEGGWEAEKISGGELEEITTAVGAGEADFTMMIPGIARTHYEGDRVDVILSIGDTAGEPWSDAATTTDIGLPDEPWGSVRGFLVPAEVPDTHRDWLYELFRAASETDAYQQRIENLPGAERLAMDHDEVVEVMQNVVEFAEPIVRDLGLHHEQN